MENAGIEAPLGVDPQGNVQFGAGTGALADFDGDAKLDLFIGNGQTSYIMTDQLFLGNGDGTFREATDQLSGNEVWPSNGSVACDVDDDGDQDIFVSVYGVSHNGAQNQLFIKRRRRALHRGRGGAGCGQPARRQYLARRPGLR